MTTDNERFQTIQRDIATIAAQVDLVKQFCRAGNVEAAWYHADLAEARLQSVSGFIGLSHEWDVKVVEQARASAAATVLPKYR
jgi:hypothetical protein